MSNLSNQRRKRVLLESSCSNIPKKVRVKFIMFKSTKINLLILPVLILICLSCPVKQEIKQFLGIPLQQQAEKSSSTQACTLFTQTKKSISKSQANEERNDLHLCQMSIYLQHLQIDTSFLSDQRDHYLGYIKPNEPLFITYRQLII